MCSRQFDKLSDTPSHRDVDIVNYPMGGVWTCSPQVDLPATLDKDQVANWSLERMKAELAENGWRVLDAVVQLDKLPANFDGALSATPTFLFLTWIQSYQDHEDPRRKLLENYCRQNLDGAIRTFAIVAGAIAVLGWIGVGAVALWYSDWMLKSLGILGFLSVVLLVGVGGHAKTCLELARVVVEREEYLRARRRVAMICGPLVLLLLGAVAVVGWKCFVTM